MPKGAETNQDTPKTTERTPHAGPHSQARGLLPILCLGGQRRVGGLLEKLEPVYRAGLAAGDHDTVLQVVELQARIAGLVHGAATVRPRALKAAQPAAGGHEAALAELAGLDADDPADDPAADADFGPEDGR